MHITVYNARQDEKAKKERWKQSAAGKRASLLDDMQRRIAKDYGIEDFDPVVQLALIGVEALQDKIIVDPATGSRTVVVADRVLAATCFSKIASFVHAPYSPKKSLSEPEEVPDQPDLGAIKQKLADALGVNLAPGATNALNT